jgi:hypothetical protein
MNDGFKRNHHIIDLMKSLEIPRLNDEFEETVHQLNKEIVRLAFAVNLDLSSHAFLHEFLAKEIDRDHDHFHKRETLKGLIVLRGQMSLKMAEAGYKDLPSPVHESIYQLLQVHQSN